MKNKTFVGLAALLVLALLVWNTAVTPGTIADPESYTCLVYGTVFSLLPPLIAIVLALITKEVYSSLMVGILTGALLYANGNLELALNTLFFNTEGGMVYKLADSWNVGILIFLVILGILVSLMNKAGGSAAFGRWASRRIKTRAGAQLATVLLGVLIFVDDYFNCLTVGSVMRPVTDRQRISRAKLAYIIDATAAPVCIIAPVSSWAAAVTSSVPEDAGINGFTMFLRTIPYNYYSILTLVMMLFLIFTGMEYGPMLVHERNAALRGDLFTTQDRPYGEGSEQAGTGKGGMIDLVAPVLVLIVSCVVGMVYTGGFFSGEDFITAFANCDASVGLVLGSSVALVFTFAFYLLRDVMSFQDFAACVPEGFKAMVAPILILTMAWTLSGMTGLLGGKYFVADLLGTAQALQYFLPAIIFVVALFLAFATGTSWGTFSILVPIVCHAFPSGEMLVVSIAATLAGAVCGDHCSPISDTTIMASAGAQSNHVNHVSTQLPYALTVAAISTVCYAIAGVAQAFLGQSAGLVSSLVLLVVAVVLELVVLGIMHARTGNRNTIKENAEAWQ